MLTDFVQSFNDYQNFPICFKTSFLWNSSKSLMLRIGAPFHNDINLCFSQIFRFSCDICAKWGMDYSLFSTVYCLGAVELSLKISKKSIKSKFSYVPSRHKMQTDQCLAVSNWNPKLVKRSCIPELLSKPRMCYQTAPAF